jgi:hypothetical protein
MGYEVSVETGEENLFVWFVEIMLPRAQQRDVFFIHKGPDIRPDILGFIGEYHLCQEGQAVLFDIVVITLEYELIGVSAPGADRIAEVAGGAVLKSKRFLHITFDKRLNICFGCAFRKIQNGAFYEALATAIAEVILEPAECVLEPHKLLSARSATAGSS